MEKHNSKVNTEPYSLAVEKQEGSSLDVKLNDEKGLTKETQSLSIGKDACGGDGDNGHDEIRDEKDQRRAHESKDSAEKVNNGIGSNVLGNGTDNSKGSSSKASGERHDNHIELDERMHDDEDRDSKVHEEENRNADGMFGEEHLEPVFDGTETEADVAEGSAWPEKAMKIKNFVKQKSMNAVTSVLRRFSGKGDEVECDAHVDEDMEVSDTNNSEAVEITPKPTELSAWDSLLPIVTKGRVIVYTKLGCQECRGVRLFLHRKKLRYFEINIDVYPGRKVQLEKFSGSRVVPKVLFNGILIGGLNELQSLDESGKLAEKIEYLIAEGPPFEAPLPPLSGEDDVSSKGPIDELSLIVRKMKGAITVKDRFYKMRRFKSCFLGSEAVNFLSEDQYLESEEAVQFGRKLASKLFFQHVLDENLFEDGNHLYRFLDDDPIVSSQCHNIPRGIIELKPKPISEIASSIQFLSYAIFEAYASEDGNHVDYRSIHGSEEFARYLRIVQELQRVELQDIKREEKLAFFINLHNMMAIHAILVLGYPFGALERRKLLGDFKYVIGGSTYSLSAIENGILRCNQRPPYNLMKPFGANDKRLQVAIPYPEPLVHFALVCGHRSGPSLRSYSSKNIDKELMEAARNFLKSGGLIIDGKERVAYASRILQWYSVDFGDNETEVLKHVSNYLEQSDAETLLQLIADSQLKVVYQSYDWGLNC